MHRAQYDHITLQSLLNFDACGGLKLRLLLCLTLRLPFCKPDGFSLHILLRGRILCRRLILGQAGHDFDLLGVELVVPVHLEVDVFDDERPDFVAEAVGI